MTCPAVEELRIKARPVVVSRRARSRHVHDVRVIHVRPPGEGDVVETICGLMIPWSRAAIYPDACSLWMIRLDDIFAMGPPHCGHCDIRRPPPIRTVTPAPHYV